MKRGLRSLPAKCLALLLAAVMVLTLCGAAATPQLEDDYYAYINADFLENTEIPPGATAVGAVYSDMENNVRTALIDDFERMLEDGVDEGAEYMESAMIYYELLKDTDRKQKGGAQPVEQYVERIEGIKTLDDLQEAAVDMILEGMPLPFVTAAIPDNQDSSKRVMVFTMPNLLLGDASYYDESDNTAAALLAALEDSVEELLKTYGYADSKAEQTAQAFMEFEQILASHTLSAEAQQADKNKDNQIDPGVLAGMAQNTDFEAVIEGLAGSMPSQITLWNAAYFENYDSVVNEENLPLLKSWMTARLLFAASPYLSEEMTNALGSFVMATTGLQDIGADKTGEEKEAEVREGAYTMVNASYGPIVGYYYATTHLDEGTRDTVTEMVEDIMAEHRKRLEENDWLSEDTVEMAIRKLDKMTFVVGYPDREPSYVDLTKADEEEIDSIYDCYVYITKEANRTAFGNVNKTIDKDDLTQLGVKLHDVNSSYVRQYNGFYIYAGMLQAPVFDMDASESANYGGIGMVIGHELSHAFDSNGAMYDEDGKMESWWTDEDMEAFQERIQAMADLFDGIPYAGGQVNGVQTVAENTADAGGISVAIAVLKTRDDHDLEAFFESYARVWAVKQTQQMEEKDLLTDIHSPPHVRVNVQCSNCDDFYDVYDIEKTDGMYLAPQDRVKIW